MKLKRHDRHIRLLRRSIRAGYRGVWEEDDFDAGGTAGSRTVYEQKGAQPEFSGLLDANGVPLFKFYDDKPGIGFHADLTDYDPDQYYYGIHPTYGPVTVGGGDDADAEEEDED
jgi:hypothetical protein